MRVLVTGGFGFLGRHVCARLARDYEVRRHTSKQCDLLEAEDVCLLFEQEDPDIVIHLAAACGGIGANQAEPAKFFYQNMLMGMNVVEESCRLGKKLVMVGTTCSYPASTPVPFKEPQLWNGYPEYTNAPYGIAKRALFEMVEAYKRQYSWDATCVIPANLYGPGDNFDLRTSHVIPAMIAKFIEARDMGVTEVELWGDGTPTREFLYVKDAADGIVVAMERYEAKGPVNLGTGNEISIHQLSVEIQKLVGYKGDVVWNTGRPNGQMRRALCTTKAWSTMKWEAKTPLLTGLKETIEWYEKH